MPTPPHDADHTEPRDDESPGCKEITPMSNTENKPKQSNTAELIAELQERAAAENRAVEPAELDAILRKE
jgi:hypothetical protein